MWSGYRLFYLFSILNLSGVLLGDDGPEVVNKWNCFLLFGHTFRLTVLKIVMGDLLSATIQWLPQMFYFFYNSINNLPCIQLLLNINQFFLCGHTNWSTNQMSDLLILLGKSDLVASSGHSLCLYYSRPGKISNPSPKYLYDVWLFLFKVWKSIWRMK